MKRETMDLTLGEIAKVIREARKICQAEMKLSENEASRLYWEGKDSGLVEAYSRIRDRLNQSVDR